jgi:hypothetical protein
MHFPFKNGNESPGPPTYFHIEVEMQWLYFMERIHYNKGKNQDRQSLDIS